ncbi:sucrose-6-phosphate hydrolase [Aquibacillus sp. 3ASR75-11]|uniref:Sucrose-6-phosphate hydrolase n=1 Tax=Terrihalobacillus insolitus TaxID=2950438 RepID=A0A9X4AL44_9BACI|nr:sucrose-6-phosphate hydrolase [Terrihalobacillus insolitus]MDC3412702.1 sucrose-6-phosphate hydrolase [Terrihalobacillus insolitus]MDC3423821.1 sucrose-6-phosphate hydrolase [Terrihalobacillus insolitus]
MNQRDVLRKEKAYKAIEKYEDVVSNDPFRMHYHIMPPVGLLNDPNGFIYYKGTYHLFYQWNPFGTEHTTKFWGHVTSQDLVNWQAQPIALAPSDWFDKDGCYSGSAIEVDGKLVIFYTGNVRDENGNRETYQCMAVSTDGVYFEKKGPIATLPAGYTPHFRDPKVWKYQDHWYMIVGAQTVNKEGTVVLFSSTDLEKWAFLGGIAGANLNGLGKFGYMWECPDLFYLDGKEVLLVSPQGLDPNGDEFNNIYQSGYFVGALDVKQPSYTHGRFHELDRGFDFYAPQTSEDSKGRRLLVGWMGIPEENEADHPTISHNWIHAMTLPRELELVKGKLYQLPVEELKTLRGKEVYYADVLLNTTEPLELDQVNGTVIELLIDVVDNESDIFCIEIGEKSKIVFDASKERLTFQRQQFKQSKQEERRCHLKNINKIQLFRDVSSIEIFVNEGEAVFSSRIFDNPTDGSIRFFASAETKINVHKWSIKRATR